MQLPLENATSSLALRRQDSIREVQNDTPGLNLGDKSLPRLPCQIHNVDCDDVGDVKDVFCCVGGNVGQRT